MKENVSVVLYPIFLKCCQYLHDPFWIYLFEDMAFGKCPYGILIKDQCIYSVLKNREFTYSLQQGKLVEEVCEDLRQIFTQKLHILSQEDHLHFRTECQKNMRNYMNNISSWNDIRKKNLKDMLIEQYTLSQKKMYNYSFNFTRKFLAIIFIGIQFKTILSRHIHYKEKSIVAIEGISCRPKRILCSYNIFISSSSIPGVLPMTFKQQQQASRQNRLVLTKISNSWKRYLASL